MKRCLKPLAALVVAGLFALSGCGDKKDTGGGSTGPGPGAAGSKGGPPKQ